MFTRFVRLYVPQPRYPSRRSNVVPHLCCNHKAAWQVNFDFAGAVFDAEPEFHPALA